MFREGRHVEKNKRRSKKYTVFFSFIFLCFLVENRWKILQKARKPCLCTKIHKKTYLERSFLATIQFLVDFWGSAGLPGAARDIPGTFQNGQFFTCIANFAGKRARTVPWKVPGSPQGSPRHPQGTILSRLFDRSCISKNMEKMSKC